MQEGDIFLPALYYFRFSNLGPMAVKLFSQRKENSDTYQTPFFLKTFQSKIVGNRHCHLLALVLSLCLEEKNH